MQAGTLSASFYILALCTVLFPETSADLQQQYIGCFADGGSSNRVMGPPNADRSMTLDRCWQNCKQSSNSFFGVEYWYECYCGDKFDTLGPADNCNTTCGGNPAQICGGDRALSVYSVCPRGRYGQDCSGLCNCRNDTSFGENCFRNGTCPAGCKNGWTGRYCATDIDECSTNKGHCSHNCANTEGSYRCSCPSGFNLGVDAHNCTALLDIDDCSVNNGNCSHASTNAPGSYTCFCPSGYRLSGDEKMCHDIDECEYDNGGCQHNCTNTVGSFQCDCATNYTLHSDGRKCDDMDECQENNGGCEQTCVNLAGGFECRCDKLNRRNESGFILNNDTRTCSNINECDDKSAICEHYCTDTAGDYECSCWLGYQQSVDDYHRCRPTAVLSFPVTASLGAALLVVIVIIIIIAVKHHKLLRRMRSFKEQTQHEITMSDPANNGYVNVSETRPQYRSMRPTTYADIAELYAEVNDKLC